MIFLTIYLSGEIIAKNDKAQFSIDIFNLNDKALNECRLQIAKSLQFLDVSLDEIYAVFPDYTSFIQNIYPKIRKSQL